MEILDKFNITPNNEKIYIEALTHPSYENENKLNFNYERLEFLGDAVLDLVISEHLYKHESIREGDMTKHRANYVCEKALYKYAKEIELGKHIFIGNGEEQSGGRDKKTILSDIFESFIGAIFIDKGFEESKRFLEKTVIPHLEIKNDNFLEDYKSALQENVQTSKRSVQYKLIGANGPSHSKMFTVAAIVGGLELGRGTATSKKEAEQMAAKKAIDKCAK